MNDQTALDLVLTELEFARSENKNITNGHYGYAVIKEELDELWDSVKTNDLENSRKEAIQVAAMAIRFYVDLE
jgi:hypothetical protein